MLDHYIQCFNSKGNQSSSGTAYQSSLALGMPSICFGSLKYEDDGI